MIGNQSTITNRGRRHFGWILALIAMGACAAARTTPLPELATSSSVGASRAPGADSMVDIGYGEMPARLTSASVTTLRSEQIRARNVRDVAELFETIPGVTVERARGRTSVRLRGVAANQSAVNTEPLIVVDGVPLSRYDRVGLAALQSLDIERIDVLRDGATAAMYGVRGGRGVILVKTKRGR